MQAGYGGTSLAEEMCRMREPSPLTCGGKGTDKASRTLRSLRSGSRLRRLAPRAGQVELTIEARTGFVISERGVIASLT